VLSNGIGRAFDHARIHVETRFLGGFFIKKMAGGFPTASLCTIATNSERECKTLFYNS